MHGTLSERNWTQPENHPKPLFVQPAKTKEKMPAEASGMAKQIRETYAETRLCVQTSFEKIRDLGGMLAQAKLKIPHGSWNKWLSNECGIPARTAYSYLAAYRELPATISAEYAETVTIRKLSAPKGKDEPPGIAREKVTAVRKLAGKTEESTPVHQVAPTAIKVLAHYTTETLRDEFLPELRRRGVIVGQEPEPKIIEGIATEVIAPVSEPIAAEILEDVVVAEPEVVEAHTATPPADPFAAFTDTDLIAELDRRLKPLGLMIKFIAIDEEPVTPDVVDESPTAATAPEAVPVKAPRKRVDTSASVPSPEPKPVKAPRKRVDTSDDPRRERARKLMKDNRWNAKQLSDRLRAPYQSLRLWVNGSQKLSKRYHASVDAALSGLETK